MIPSINVNLTQCGCGPILQPHHSREHLPILIPCRLPGSVTFTVTAGACDNGTRLIHMPGGVSRCSQSGHHEKCPARPVRVACSISGPTWKDSHISDMETLPDHQDPSPAVADACRARWGFIKSALLGHSLSDCPQEVQNLRSQRDAVFEALADMARMERAYYDAAKKLAKAMPAVHVGSDMQVCDPDDAPSARWLAAYVEQLREKVEVLP